MHSSAKSYLGMALVPDIIHHAFSGNRNVIFGRDASNPFRSVLLNPCLLLHRFSQCLFYLDFYSRSILISALFTIYWVTLIDNNLQIFK